jgi:hypothetical protein
LPEPLGNPPDKSESVITDSSNHDIELDYSVITDSDLSGGLPSGSGKDVGHLFFLIL